MKILLTGASSDIGLKLTRKLIKNIENFSEITLIFNSSSISEKTRFNNYKKIKLIKQNLLHSFSKELKTILDRKSVV